MIDASQIAVDFIEDLKLENAQLRANVAELDQRLLESNQAYLDRLVIVEAENSLDDEGLPLDRPPTLDDVRGADGGGRIIAIGCTGLVILVVLGFWALRGFLAH